jgi:hypothetical protein
LLVESVPPDSNGPSSWFLTTSTVSSTKKHPGLLHPGHGPEVRCVSARDALGIDLNRPARVVLMLPRNAVHTLRRIPSPTAVPHHCGRCPPDISTRRSSRRHNACAMHVPWLPSAPSGPESLFL